MDTQEKREEFLKQEFTKVTARIKDILNESFGEVEASYLPWLESDTTSNVRGQARSMIESFLTNEETNPFGNDGFPPGYSRKIRDKIYEENKSEIIEIIGADLKKDLDFYKELLESERKMRRY